MNTPKLPPLPHWCEAGSPFAEQMQAYAIAAIEAQGVPGVADFDQLQAMQAEWNTVCHDNSITTEAKFQRVYKAAMLASAPPAPQCAGDPGECAYNGACMYACGLKDPPAPQAKDNWRKYATEREDTAQAVIERHRKEHESLLRLLAKDRKTIAELKAAVVQQEAAAAWQQGYDQGVIDERISEANIGIAGFDAKVNPARQNPYTHHAQQAKPQPLSDAARDVLAERQRQIEVEGWTPEHDDDHDDHSLSIAAACYALAEMAPALGISTVRVSSLWDWTGWSSSWFKPKSRRENLIRAAALLLAEIDRLDRAKAAHGIKE